MVVTHSHSTSLLVFFFPKSPDRSRSLQFSPVTPHRPAAGLGRVNTARAVPGRFGASHWLGAGRERGAGSRQGPAGLAVPVTVPPRRRLQLCPGTGWQLSSSPPAHIPAGPCSLRTAPSKCRYLRTEAALSQPCEQAVPYPSAPPGFSPPNKRCRDLAAAGSLDQPLRPALAEGGRDRPRRDSGLRLRQPGAAGERWLPSPAEMKLSWLGVDVSRVLHLAAVFCLTCVLLKAVQLYHRRRELLRALADFPGHPTHWLFGHVHEVEREGAGAGRREPGGAGGSRGQQFPQAAGGMMLVGLIAMVQGNRCSQPQGEGEGGHPLALQTAFSACDAWRAAHAGCCKMHSGS